MFADNDAITISTASRIRNNENFGSCTRANFYNNCCFNFNPCGISEKTDLFSKILNQELEQGQLITTVCYRSERKNRPEL